MTAPPQRRRFAQNYARATVPHLEALVRAGAPPQPCDPDHERDIFAILGSGYGNNRWSVWVCGERYITDGFVVAGPFADYDDAEDVYHALISSHETEPCADCGCLPQPGHQCYCNEADEQDDDSPFSVF